MLLQNMRTYASRARTKDDGPGALVLVTLFLIGVGGVSLARSFVQIGYAAFRGKAPQVPMPTDAIETGPEDNSAYALDLTDMGAHEFDTTNQT